MKPKHKGKNTHRLEQNPLEAKFARAWNAHNQQSDTLDYIIGGNSREEDFVTDRDRLVAASVIQWLGSPVGQTFLSDVTGKTIYVSQKF